MTDEIQSLILSVESRDVESASHRLDTLVKSSKGAETASGSLKSAFYSLASQVGAFVSVTATLHKLVDVARTFQVLESSLVTVTGSAEDAAVAMQAIKDFAASTPFSVEQTTNAFIRLTALGLNPGSAALLSYGNTASAMGKPLLQFVEAVADATIGQFIRLREFGIDASKQGDEVAFRFKGVTTTVKNNSQEIQEYLRKIGDTDFAGAMERRAATLDGALSNLADHWDFLFVEINKAGIGDVMAESIAVADKAIVNFTNSIASGQLLEQIRAIGSTFSDVAEGIPTVFGIAQSGLMAIFAAMSRDGQMTASDIEKAFSVLPITVSAYIKNAVVDYAAEFDMARANIQDMLGFSLDGLTVNKEEPENAKEAINKIIKARDASKASIIEEQDAAIKSYEAQIAKADELRAKYEADEKARRASKEDVLAQFDIGATGAKPKTAAEVKSEKTAAEKRETALSGLKVDLLREEKAIEESHKRRESIILKNTVAGSDTQKELLKANQDSMREELVAYYQGQRDLAEQGLLSEEDMIVKSFERKRALILENTAITEDEKNNLIIEAERIKNENLKELDEARDEEASRFFGNTLSKQMDFAKRTEALEKSHGANRAKIIAGTLADLTANASQHSRTMFEINKAATVAQIILDTPRAVSGAYAFGASVGGPYVGAAFGAIAFAAEAAQLAAAMSATFQGGGRGSSPSAVATSPVVNDTPVAPAQQQSAGSGGNANASAPQIHIYGDIYSNNAEIFYDQLKTMINDQDFILIENSSRQSSELRSA